MCLSVVASPKPVKAQRLNLEGMEQTKKGYKWVSGSVMIPHGVLIDVKLVDF